MQMLVSQRDSRSTLFNEFYVGHFSNIVTLFSLAGTAIHKCYKRPLKFKHELEYHSLWQAVPINCYQTSWRQLRVEQARKGKKFW